MKGVNTDKYVEVPRGDTDVSGIFDEVCGYGKVSLDILNRVAYLRLRRRPFYLWGEDTARTLLEIDHFLGVESDFYLVRNGEIVLNVKLGQQAHVKRVANIPGLDRLIDEFLLIRARRKAVKICKG